MARIRSTTDSSGFSIWLFTEESVAELPVAANMGEDAKTKAINNDMALFIADNCSILIILISLILYLPD
jgi:hypothetical protein